MKLRPAGVFIVQCAWLCTIAGTSLAAELTTESERIYHELKRAKDAKNQLLADRWYNLIRQQEWDDATGKHKTTAKYVEHDPNLESVTLRVIRGTGANRVVKDVQIPLARLSKTSQSRVRQIAFLKERVATAAVEAAKEPAADEATGEMPVGEMSRESERLESPEDSSERNPGGQMALQDAVAGSSPEAPVASRGSTPLPAQLPPLPSADSQIPQAAAVPPTDHPADRGAPARTNLADDALWRTDYAAFCKNITANDRGYGVYDFDWGPMVELKQAYNIHKKWEDFGSVDADAQGEIADALEQVGEVHWEATLKQLPDDEGYLEFDLPPLPEPWEFTYQLDTERDPGQWHDVKVGDRVRFVGRFDWFDETYGLVIAVQRDDSAAGDASDGH